MKKIVLLVEDKPEEIAKGREILQAAGFLVAVATTLDDANRLWTNLGDKLVGIITDIHFPHGMNEMKNQWGVNPVGLVLVLKAKLEKMPIVVCSETGGHNAPYLIDFFQLLAKLNGEVPFCHNKNWKQAIANLVKLLKGEVS
jgi:CheY-like chemotaxis protein